MAWLACCGIRLEQGPLSAASCLPIHINRAWSCSEGEALLSAVNAFSQRWCVDPNSEGLAGCVIVACSLRLILLSGFLGDIMCLPAEQRWAGRRKGGGEGTAGAALPSGSVHGRVWACSSQVWYGRSGLTKFSLSQVLSFFPASSLVFLPPLLPPALIHTHTQIHTIILSHCNSCRSSAVFPGETN